MISRIEAGYLLALHQIKGLGNQSLQAIHGSSISFQQAWEEPELLIQKRIIDQTTRSMLLTAKRFMSPEQCEDELRRFGCSYLTRWSPEYPEEMENLHDIPAVIYYQGNLQLTNQVSAAIVGSRNATVYGKKVAALLGQQLGEAGITIVSGVARGIDSTAHRAALATEGSTIGVLGSGLDVVYPPENKQLYQDIAENGLLISEFPVGTKPNAGNFPRRNRIIAALARAVIVVEANEKSGALITTDHALELGREVWAVPGPITSPQSRGTNQLIRDGALLALEAGEIINCLLPGFGTAAVVRGQMVDLNLEEGRIMEVIGEYPVHLDEIAATLDVSHSDLAGLLLKLELKGIITCLAGNHYVRNNYLL
ncbi:MAG: DNA-processing protein DprA [Methylocystaceae bacterium]